MYSIFRKKNFQLVYIVVSCTPNVGISLYVDSFDSIIYIITYSTYSLKLNSTFQLLDLFLVETFSLSCTLIYVLYLFAKMGDLHLYNIDPSFRKSIRFLLIIDSFSHYILCTYYYT